MSESTTNQNNNQNTGDSNTQTSESSTNTDVGSETNTNQNESPILLETDSLEKVPEARRQHYKKFSIRDSFGNIKEKFRINLDKDVVSKADYDELKQKYDRSQGRLHKSNQEQKSMTETNTNTQTQQEQGQGSQNNQNQNQNQNQNAQENSRVAALEKEMASLRAENLRKDQEAERSSIISSMVEGNVPKVLATSLTKTGWSFEEGSSKGFPINIETGERLSVSRSDWVKEVITNFASNTKGGVKGPVSGGSAGETTPKTGNTNLPKIDPLSKDPKDHKKVREGKAEYALKPLKRATD